MLLHGFFPIWFVLSLSLFTSSWTNNPPLAAVFCSLTFPKPFPDKQLARLYLASYQLQTPYKSWIGRLTHVVGASGVASFSLFFFPPFLCLFPAIPPFSHLFFRLAAGAPCCWAVTGLQLGGKFTKGRVVIGLLSSPLGSGMRPDLIRHQDGPLMDMSFNPFPPGGRNGSWRGRGETPRLIWLIWSIAFFYPNPQLFIGSTFAIGTVWLSAQKTAEFLTKVYPLIDLFRLKLLALHEAKVNIFVFTLKQVRDVIYSFEVRTYSRLRGRNT